MELSTISVLSAHGTKKTQKQHDTTKAPLPQPDQPFTLRGDPAGFKKPRKADGSTVTVKTSPSSSTSISGLGSMVSSILTVF